MAFGIGYLVMLAALHRPAAVADVIVVAGTLVYTVGELLASPITATLAVEAAPDHMRGRYLSLNQLALALATALSPAVYTLLLARGPSTTWLALTTLALAGLALSIVSGRALPRLESKSVDQTTENRRFPGTTDQHRGSRIGSVPWDS